MNKTNTYLNNSGSIVILAILDKEMRSASGLRLTKPSISFIFVWSGVEGGNKNKRQNRLENDFTQFKEWGVVVVVVVLKAIYIFFTMAQVNMIKYDFK